MRCRFARPSVGCAMTNCKGIRNHGDRSRCGMQVSPENAAATLDHRGHTYYFCSKHCLDAFASDPERYVNKSHDATNVKHAHDHGHGVAMAGEYTCPMHPEIRRDGPGNCPICGMALVPVA